MPPSGGAKGPCHPVHPSDEIAVLVSGLLSGLFIKEPLQSPQHLLKT